MFAMQPEQCNTPLVSEYTAGFFGSGGKNRHVPSKGLWPNAAGEKSNRTISLFIRWLSILSPLTGISALAAVQLVGFSAFLVERVIPEIRGGKEPGIEQN